MHTLSCRPRSLMLALWLLFFSLPACGDGSLTAGAVSVEDGSLADQSPLGGALGAGGTGSGAGDPADGVYLADAGPLRGDIGLGAPGDGQVHWTGDGAPVGPGSDAATPDAAVVPPPPTEPPPPSAPPPPPPSAPPPLAVFFNEPGDAAVETLQTEMIRLVDLASAGSELRISMYEWGQPAYVDAVLRAAGRGVDVRIVMNGTDDTIEPAIHDALSAGLGADRLTSCPRGACIGTGINHNKFLLLSHLDDGSLNVVVQGSHNFKSSQNWRFNHLVVVRGDNALYGEYRSYWNDLRAGQQSLDYYRSFTGDSGVKGYFFPRASGDLIVSVLDNVHCDAGAEIHVAMAFFKNDRVEVADKLRALHDAGCAVRMVFGNYPDADPDQASPGADTRAALRGMDWVVYDLPNVTVHSKYMLIRARYGEGAVVETLVFAGSHNWTGAALRRNDEAVMRLEDAASYQAFLADWNLMRSRLP
ncbi:MAG: phosphatidylserine/phosphatidylglycerophosphate/cardiolipin synthase family protein [Myxococcales bacterium]|nr:phosphatidylserine/phosphatidylglycerophosphate/cardiolipin synthase family protein [Myxococcales bacterium]